MTDPALWDATAQETVTGADSLRDSVDLAVVGGGFTGLATALFAAQAGLTVQVLEAGAVGTGGSGRNVGLVNAGLWLPPDDLEARLGPVRGPRFVDLFGEGPQRVFDLIERHQIRCEATRAGTLHAAHKPRAMAGLRDRHATWAARGAPVRLMDAQEMAEVTGTRAFAGGLEDRRAGTVNPMAYARGLARVARSAGAALATDTPVTALRQEGAAWRVETGTGTLAARKLVLATNAYSAHLWPGLERCFARLRYVQLSTPPLGERAATVLPGGQGLWDTGTIMRSVRKDAEGRIILGTMGRLSGDAANGRARTWAARALARLYPALADVGFEAAWDGVIAMTPDKLPRILELAPGLYCPVGYNGRGITTGTLFGEALGAFIASGDAARLPLPLTQPERMPFRRTREAAIDLACALNQRV